jgi:protein gp37
MEAPMNKTPAEKLARLLEREGTGISWAALTFNPWLGCQKVGPACDHCYAEEFVTGRLGHMEIGWGPHAPRRRTAAGNWNKPPRWNRIAQEAGSRLTVFCASLADVCDTHETVLPEWRADLAALILATPFLDWMLLTKRIGNARKVLQGMFPDGVPPNVALGVTIARQNEAERDLPLALSIKAGLGIKRLFVSAEPLLGPLALARYLPGIDLVIVGGESGAKARPMHPAWVRSLRDQCRADGVPFHFKQWGEWAEDENVSEADWADHVDPQANLAAGKATILPNGAFHGRGYFPREARAAAQMRRVGVKRAGYRLDGREHREHFNERREYRG